MKTPFPPKTLRSTPARLGYVFPPEWRRHAATWLTWPRPQGVTFPDNYDAAVANYAAIAAHIAARERVEIIVSDADAARIAARRLADRRCPLNRVRFHVMATNECWCRDSGPAFVIRRRAGRTESAVVDWVYNAWGGKYPPFDSDDALPTRIAADLALNVFSPGIVMEGGSVDFNGAGTVLTTESCLLNKNRNPSLSKVQIEQYLKDYYGQLHVCWLGHGIAGDDTDGHVDDLARFLDARTIAAAVEEDPRDENYAALRDNLRRIAALRDPAGRPFRVVELPMPGVVQHKGERLPATYVNFYFVNGALLVPTFRQRRRDRRALEILQRRLPRRRVIGIDCLEVIQGLGAIHCLTQQQPAS